jgi:di/tricarboxylate transporter
MYRRYRERRRRRYGSEYRGRSAWMRPSVQLTIVLIALLIGYILLSSGGR